MRTALLAGGLGLFTLVGALFAYNSRSKPEPIPREKVLAIAKQLRQQMFMSMVEVACFVKQNASKFPPEQLREHVLDESSSFMKSFKDKLAAVFRDFTEEQYQENVEKFYKDDIEIQYHLKKYQQEFDKAILGVTPEFREEIVTFLSAGKLLKITKELLNAKMQRITQKIKQKVTFQQMVIILRTTNQQQKNLRSQKLKQLGLVGKDQELAAIFQFAIAKYLKIDKEFEKAYNQLLEQYKMKSNQHVDRFCAFPRSTSKQSLSSSSQK